MEALKRWLRYQRARWAWMRLRPDQQEALQKCSPETMRKIGALLDARREHSRHP